MIFILISEYISV